MASIEPFNHLGRIFNRQTNARTKLQRIVGINKMEDYLPMSEKDGKLTYEEFLAMLNNHTHVGGLFAVFDGNEDGAIQSS